MRGSIVNRGRSYSVVIELARDPATGKRRQQWHSGYRTKREAEKAKTGFLSALDRGVYVKASRQTVAEYLHEWLDAITPTVRPSTISSYRRNVELHAISHLGAAHLTDVDGGVLNALYARLLLDGRKNQAGGGLSPRSVRYIHTILHRAFKDAVRWNRLARNPADQADPPRGGTSPEPVTWSPETLNEFLSRSAAYGDRYLAAWILLATTGMRRGEALGLRWSDLNLDGARAAIVQTVVAVGHEVRFSTPKTAKGRRSVSLDSQTVEALRQHRARQAEDRLALGPGWPDHGLVFTKIDGTPVHPERFSREFDRRIQRWDLPKIRLHDLRHTWATLALETGVHPRVVQERLGHSTVGITLNTYSHVTAAMDSAAAGAVASLFLKPGSSDVG
jgi:integrase